MRLIDPNALMEKVCGNCPGNDCKPDATDTVYGCELAEIINQMPTIESEPVRHGRWIDAPVPMNDKIESGSDLHDLNSIGKYILRIKKETTENEHRVFMLTVYKDWIPCSERMPEKHVEVLAYSPFWGKIIVALWGGEFWLEQWTDDDLEQSEITHWMPLPEPPEGGADDAT